jgi:hypothetical protein
MELITILTFPPAVLKKISYFLMMFLASISLFPREYVYNEDLDIHPLPFALRIFTLDKSKNIIGRTVDDGNTLYKIIDNGNSLKKIYTFPEPVVGIRVMDNNDILVSTDRDHWDPHTPCNVYLSKDNGHTFSIIKTLTESGAIWWSMSADKHNIIYIGEYGPKGVNQSKRVWKSPDFGKSWSIIFTAPNVEGVHIHLVAVDPFTQALWVSYGDDRDGVLVSYDQGHTWNFIVESQPTAIIFTRDNIYFGEDEPGNGAVSVYDKADGSYKRNLFKVKKFGNYAGPVYDMAMGSNGILYVPFMKYPFLEHKPSLWISDGKEWNLIMECTNAQKAFEGFENIAGPDRFGYIYTYKYKIKDFSSLPLKNPGPGLPENGSVVPPGRIRWVWSQVKGADSYRLLVAEDPRFKKKILKAVVNQSFYTSSLPGNKQFYWKVKSLKKHMLTTGWSKVYGFKTLPGR